jgi:hypothetical protein
MPRSQVVSISLVPVNGDITCKQQNAERTKKLVRRKTQKTPCVTTYLLQSQNSQKQVQHPYTARPSQQYRDQNHQRTMTPLFGPLSHAVEWLQAER